MSMPTEMIINPESRVRSPNSEEQILAENGFFWRETGAVKTLVCRALEENGFAGGFSTRLGGVSPFPENDLNLAGYDEDAAENIAENRRRFLAGFGGDYALATVWQIHGDGVKIIRDAANAENSPEKYDALASNLENILLGVKTADCVPVLLGDKKNKAFAAIHAGWRGTVASIAVKTIEKMRENFQTAPENLIAAIGPAAGCKNYEIGADVIAAFRENFPHGANLFTATRENHALIDLHRANREQLVTAGVPAENISVAPFCTMERADLFFSYRREKKTLGKTGRLLSVIGVK